LRRAELQRLGLLLGATIIIGIVAFSPLLQQTTARGSLGFVAIGPLLWAALRHPPVALAPGDAAWGEPRPREIARGTQSSRLCMRMLVHPLAVAADSPSRPLAGGSGICVWIQLPSTLN
jgi:hypothetical protein